MLNRSRHASHEGQAFTRDDAGRNGNGGCGGLSEHQVSSSFLNHVQSFIEGSRDAGTFDDEFRASPIGEGKDLLLSLGRVLDIIDVDDWLAPHFFARSSLPREPQ